MKIGDVMAVTLEVESGSVEGKATVSVPSSGIPLLMELRITRASMKGKVYFDPQAGKVVASEETYELLIEARGGLPSLKPGEKIGKGTAGISFPATYKIDLQSLKKPGSAIRGSPGQEATAAK